MQCSVLYLSIPSSSSTLSVALLGPQLIAFHVEEWKRLVLDSYAHQQRQLAFASSLLCDPQQHPQEEPMWPPPPPVSFCDGAFATSSYIRKVIQAAPVPLPDLERLLLALQKAGLGMQRQLLLHEQAVAQILTPSTTMRPRFSLHADRVHPSPPAAENSLWLDKTQMPAILVDHQPPPEPYSYYYASDEFFSSLPRTRNVKTSTDPPTFLQRKHLDAKSKPKKKRKLLPDVEEEDPSYSPSRR